MPKKTDLDDAEKNLGEGGLPGTEIDGTTMTRSVPAVPGSGVMNPVAERIRTADSIEDVLDRGELVGLEDAALIGATIEVRGWENRGISEKFGSEWGVMDFVLPGGIVYELDGEALTKLSVGSENIVAQLDWIANHPNSPGFPVIVEVIERTTASGYQVYRLVRPKK